MKNKMLKRICAGMLVFAMLISEFVLAPKTAKAQNGQNPVRYQTVEYSAFKLDFDANQAPTCNLTNENDANQGYLFAGWYTADGTAITDDNVSTIVSSTDMVNAKFVSAHLAGIACQVKENVNDTETTSTSLRVVSAVHSANYAKVGFNVYGRQRKNDGTYMEWQMYGYGTGRETKCEKVYTGMYEYALDEEGNLTQKGTKLPKDLFGADAASEDFKFIAMSLSGIPKSFYDTTLVIKPYWVTLDGTYVEGLGEYNRITDRPVSEGGNGIVNVSVNIKNASELAAGLLNITYNCSNFTLVEAECGRVFEEMDFTEVTGENGQKTMKCVGNVKNISSNATQPNDIYVNLRLTKTDANNLGAGAAEFAVAVPDKGFCNIDEKIQSITTWDVKY